MDNINLATVLADTLISSDLISKHNFDETVSLIEQKLAFHLGDDRGAFLEMHITQNERPASSSGGTMVSEFDLENTAIKPGSLTGTVYKKDMAIQTFTVDEDGKFAFANVGQPSDVMALAGKLNEKDGILNLTWNTAPGVNHVLVTYEYFRPQESK